MSDKNYLMRYSIDQDTGDIRSVEFRFRDSPLFTKYHPTKCVTIHRDAATNELVSIVLEGPVSFDEWAQASSWLDATDSNFLWNCIPCQFMEGDWT